MFSEDDSLERYPPKIDDNHEAGTPLAFFTLVFALSLPFWVLGYVFDVELMPGLPLASLMVVCPALAAVILRWRAFGGRRAVAFLGRAVDVRRLSGPAFIALLILINPVIYAVSYAIQRAMGVDLPAPDIRLGPTLVLLALFLVAATAEELGWTGHVLEPLRRRWGIVGAGLIIGLACALWHVVALVQVGRAIDWILWWALGTVTARVLIVWLYTRTGQSVFGISLYHALSNLCWQSFPVQGSYFDPRIDALVTVAIAIVLVRNTPAKRPDARDGVNDEKTA